VTTTALTASPFCHTRAHKHLQTKEGESWQLVSYVHSEVHITIQWDGGGGPRVADQDLQAEHKSVSVYRVRGWSAFD